MSKQKSVDQDLAQRIRDAVERRFPGHGTQKNAAEHIGIDQPHLSKIINGKHTPEFDTLRKIAVGVGVPVLRLLGEPEEELRSISLPVLGVVSAGKGIDDPADAGETIEVDPDQFPPDAVSYRVRGDSMAGDSIEHGDWLIVVPRKRKELIPDGKNVVVYVPDMGMLVKLKQQGFYSSINDHRVTTPIPITRECHEYGVYVGLVRKVPADEPKGKKKGKGKP